MNEVKNLNEIQISFDETYHLINGKRLYEKNFNKVMSFHSPGVAAVEDDTGAYHIDTNGAPLYSHKFLKTFGFYDKLATVIDETGWFHVNLKGEPVYKNRFTWTGNFQEKRCCVRDDKGNYFHIKPDGKPAYFNKYKYVGDFKYGIAVVYKEDGQATHIDQEGNGIHGKKFLELGVYHKGYAIAKDDNGYFHVDKNGDPLYTERFKAVEPFYNGFSFTINKNNEKILINEKGKTIQKLLTEEDSLIQQQIRTNLMSMLVGYWKTQIIYSIVKLEVLDRIKEGKNTFEQLQSTIMVPVQSLDLIIRLLKVWNFIEITNDQFEITYKGKILTENHPKSLKYAALMWGEEHYKIMGNLYSALQTYEPQAENVIGTSFFQFYLNNIDKGTIYNRAMREYSLDYDYLIKKLEFKNTKILLDIGGGTGSLLSKILIEYKNIRKGILFDQPLVIKQAKKIFENNLINNVGFIEGDFFDKIPIQADTIIISRVLHDWNDDRAIKILNNIFYSLEENGTLLILDMIIPDDLQIDFGISSNFNLLVMVGGKERTLKNFKAIFQRTNFEIKEIIPTNSIISIIKLQKVTQ